MYSVALFVKRLLDVILCAIVFIFVLPLFALIPVIVKMSSPGPALFIQKRIGRNGKQFDIIKFRTMVLSTKAQSKNWSKEEEVRITPVGRFLRDYGLDELPQLYNILKGDMSIVGPRALMPVTFVDFSLERKKKLTKMRPGILCLSAINGRRSLSVDKRIEYQINYVNEWSLALDFKILWRSLFIVFMRKNVNEIVT